VRWLFGKAFERAGESLSLMFLTLNPVAVQPQSNFAANPTGQYA